MEGSKRFFWGRAIRLAAGCLLAVCGNAMAADTSAGTSDTGTDSNSNQAPLLQPVEVKVPPQADRSKSVSFLDQEDFSKHRFSILDDVLFFGIPGVATSRAENIGAFNPASGFLIRGLERSDESVYVDGIPSQATNHFHPISSQYTPDLIDRIEIDRSPTGVTDGPNAVGTVHIFTPPVPRHGVTGYIGGLAGSFDTHLVNGRGGVGWGSGGATLGGQYRATGGIRDQGLHAFILHGKVSQDLTSRWSTELRAAYGQLEQDDTNPVGAPRTDGVFCFCTTSGSATFDRSTEHSTSTFALYVNDTTFYNRRLADGTPVNQKTNDEREYGTRLKQTWSDLFPGNTATIGFDAVHYFGTQPERTSAELYSPYVKAYQSFNLIGTQKTVFNAGVRGTFSSDYNADFSPEVGVVQHVSRTLALRANVSQGFQIPRFQELATTPTQVGATNLDPARFYDEEIGLNKVFRLFGRRGVFDIDGFLQQGNNLFVSVPVNATQTQVVNSGNFKNQGIESTFDYEFAPGAKLHLAETYLNLEANRSRRGAVPQQTFDAGLDIHATKRVRLILQTRAANRIRFTNPNNGQRQKLDNYWVTNAKAIFALTHALALGFDIENLTDEKYATFRANDVQPGIAYYVSFRYAPGDNK